MKFPRNARIFRGQLDAAPFLSVFFLLTIFVMLGSLVYTPGVHVQLPFADDLPGTDQQRVAVAIDAGGRFYYRDHLINEAELRGALVRAAKQSPEPLILVVEADVAATTEMQLRLYMLARGAGITNALLATLPRPLAASPWKTTR